MELTKEDLLFIKKVAEDNLAGAYDPAKLTKVVEMLTGNKEPMHIRRKKQKVMAYYNYSLRDAMKKFDYTELAVEPDNGSNLNHTHTEEELQPLIDIITGANLTEDSEVQIRTSGDTEVVKEKVDLVKPATKKKRVVRKKKHKSNLNLDA